MSRDSVPLTAGVVSFRATIRRATPAPASAPVQAPVPTSSPVDSASMLAGLSTSELKDLQRRAFERGAELARAELSQKFDQAFRETLASRAALEAERKALRETAGAFVTELALGIAEELLGAALQDGRHDVRRLVEAAVAEALPVADAGALTASLHPEDLAELEQAVSLKPLATARDVVLRADPSLARGACRILSGGAEVSADPAERFKLAAQRVRAAAAKMFQGGGHDPL